MSCIRVVLSSLAAVTAMSLVGCAETGFPADSVAGVVIEVTGGLIEIESFVVLDSSGDSHKFFPRDGMQVVGSPVAHLRDHLISGERVRVMFYKDPSGSPIADDVVHASDD